MGKLRSTIKEEFPGKNIVVVGDLVADQFLKGTISRVSREAPVFILRHDQTVTLPGAAGNAAANVAALGGTAILIGLAGQDANGELLMGKLPDLGVATDNVVRDTSLSTTTKVRVLAGQHYAARQQVIRIDYENSSEVSAAVKDQLRAALASAATVADAIVVSDYDCGAVFPEIYDDAKAIAAKMHIPLVVDSRYRLAEYRDATSATPNREEVEKILGERFNEVDCEALRARLGYEALLVTNGNQGMTLFEKDKSPLHIDAIGPKEPVDVTGAGDTVIAAYALGLASRLAFAEAATVADHAGGIVVMKKGTAVVTLDELDTSLASGDESEISTHAS